MRADCSVAASAGIAGVAANRWSLIGLGVPNGRVVAERHQGRSASGRSAPARCARVSRRRPGAEGLLWVDSRGSVVAQRTTGIVEGFRMPASHCARGCTEAGVRKASKEETAGEFAPTLVSVYGEFAGAA
jgi:hypothetical protein